MNLPWNPCLRLTGQKWQNTSLKPSQKYRRRHVFLCWLRVAPSGEWQLTQKLTTSGRQNTCSRQIFSASDHFTAKYCVKTVFFHFNWFPFFIGFSAFPSVFPHSRIPYGPSFIRCISGVNIEVLDFNPLLLSGYHVVRRLLSFALCDLEK